MVDFNIETFTKQETNILNQFFTNTDKPVFGLINLPEVVKGALFARYSRSEKSLRRLFLDEFYTKEFGLDKKIKTNQPEVGTKRATTLYDKMFLQFGDDSVAQLGGAHIACEQVSNILAKIIERGRLAAYLEQSTRYVFYNQKINNEYKYLVPNEINQSPLNISYKKSIDNLFDTYSTIINKLIPYLKDKYPKDKEQSERAWNTTLNAKACDIVRGLLPASTKTNLGIYANGQAYEYMLVKMFASNNKEVIAYATMMLEELRKIIPSFLKRVDRDDRGKIWTKYISDIEQDMNNKAIFDRIEKPSPVNDLHEVELLEWDNNAINKIVSDALYEFSDASQSLIDKYVTSLNSEEKSKILKAYFGNRKNRRHKPGRAIENIYYKFDIVSDYGAFRDIQRHRMLNIQWQKISPNNGYIVPEELNEYPELKSMFISAITNTIPVYNELLEKHGREIAQYVIPFAYKIRYSINMNLREAFHLIELRTQKQGHSSYRKVCIDMANQIKSKANHNILIDAMKYIDYSFYDLSRKDSEINIDNKIK